MKITSAKESSISPISARVVAARRPLAAPSILTRRSAARSARQRAVPPRGQSLPETLEVQKSVLRQRASRAQPVGASAAAAAALHEVDALLLRVGQPG